MSTKLFSLVKSDLPETCGACWPHTGHFNVAVCRHASVLQQKDPLSCSMLQTTLFGPKYCMKGIFIHIQLTMIIVYLSKKMLIHVCK